MVPLTAQETILILLRLTNLSGKKETFCAISSGPITLLPPAVIPEAAVVPPLLKADHPAVRVPAVAAEAHQ